MMVMTDKKEGFQMYTHFLNKDKIKCFKPCFLLFFVVLLLSVIFYFLGEIFPDVKQLLAASSNSPWGIITSIFIHENSSHLTNNMQTLAIFTLIFVFSNISYDEKEVRKRTVFFITVAVFAAVFSNVLWVIIRPNTLALGASGLVYATIGATFGFSTSNFIYLSFNLPVTKKTWKQLSKKDKASFLFLYLVNLLAFLYILFFALFFTPHFLSEGPKVNVFVHGVSFYTSFLLCVMRTHFPIFSSSLLNNEQIMEKIKQLLVLLFYEVNGFLTLLFLTLMLLLGGIFKFLSLFLVMFISVYTISSPILVHFYRSVYTYIIILPIPFLGSWIISLMFFSSLNIPIILLCLLTSLISLGLVTIMHFMSKMQNIVLRRIPLAMLSREGAAFISLLLLCVSFPIFGSTELNLPNRVTVYCMLLPFYAATSMIYVNSMYRYRLLCKKLNLKRIEPELFKLWDRIERKFVNQSENIDLLRYYFHNALAWFIGGDYEKAFMDGYKVIREPTVVDPTKYVNDKRKNKRSFSEVRTILMHSKRRELKIDVKIIREVKRNLPQDCVDLLERDMIFLRKIAFE